MRLPRALPVLGRSFMDLWENIFVLAVANLVWILCFTPAVAVLAINPPYMPVILAVVLVLALGPPTIAIYAMTSDVTRYEKLEAIAFVSALRQFWRRGILMVALNVFAFVVFFSDIVFYNAADIEELPKSAIITLSFLLYLVWLMMQLYALPLAVRSKTKFLLLYRNALIATFKYPGLSLPLLITVGLLLAAATATVLPMILLGMPFIALVSNRALSTVLELEDARATALRGNSPNTESPLATLAAEEKSAAHVAVETGPVGPPITTQSKDAQSVAASGVRRRPVPPSDPRDALPEYKKR